MINRAVFINSMNRLKIYSWKDAVVVIILLSFLPVIFCIGVMLAKHMQSPVAIARAFARAYRSDFLLLLTAFVMISNAAVSMRAVGDSEPLSLVFSRPVSRFQYVISKWLAGCICVSAMFLVSALLLQLAVSALAIDYFFFDQYFIVNVLLNASSYCALVTFLHCLPAPFGIGLYGVTAMVVSFGEDIGRAPADASNLCLKLLRDAIVFASDWLYDFLHLTVDVYPLLHSIAFDWLQPATYLSNIAFFLLAGTWVLTRREFFYASS